jgi:hypothetical protein
MRKLRRVVRPWMERLDDRCLLSGYNVAQVTHAYGLDAITFPSASGQRIAGDGSGETIALIEAYNDPNLASDLHVFDQANGLPDPSLSVVNQAGTKTNSVWASEEMMDVEWAHAIAPGASLLNVEARSDALGDLITAVDLARNTPNVAVISMSWGFNETASETAFDAHFQTPSGHQGITFVAASGDYGTADGPEYPSCSPRVLAVGGTTLSVDALGDYLGEFAWSDSGGGSSPFEPQPSYQGAVQSSSHRTTPDVAFLGDPNTGVAVYETPPRGGSGSWITVGGTSLGTPAWAAIIAIVDQGRALAGKGSLDGPTQTLPALYSLPPTDFHAVPAPPPYSPWGGGLNPFGFSFHGWTFLRHPSRRKSGSSSGTASGSNSVTGRGSPIGNRLIPDLVASDLSVPLSLSSGKGGPHHHASARSARHRASSRSQASPGPHDAPGSDNTFRM